MSDQAALNGKRQKRWMTRDALVKKYTSAFGYKVIRRAECPICKEELEEAAQSQGYTGVKPPWGNAYCAINFYKKGKPRVIACPCGYRHKINYAFTERTKCKGKGCHAVVGEREIEDNEGLCYKCKPYDPINVEMRKVIGVCSRKGCQNKVPNGRKKVCYQCIPPRKDIKVVM